MGTEAFGPKEHPEPKITYRPPGNPVMVEEAYCKARAGEVLFTFKYTDHMSKGASPNWLYRAWFRQKDGSYVKQPLMKWNDILKACPKPEALWGDKATKHPPFKTRGNE